MQLLMIGGDDPKILRVRLSNGTLDIVARVGLAETFQAYRRKCPLTR
jgi:hypothetical protein